MRRVREKEGEKERKRERERIREKEREREAGRWRNGVKRKNGRISMSHREEITLLYVGWTEEERCCTKCVGGRTSWVEINR